MTAVVHRVRVYIDQAAVTWRIRVPADPASPTVRFTGLPTSYEHDTLRAEAWAIDADARRPLDVVEVSSRSTAAPADDRRIRVQTELDRLDAALAELDDDEATDRFGLARLEQYADAATTKVSLEWMDKDPPIARWLETFDLLRQQRQGWAKARQDRQQRRQQLQIEKADRLAELQALGDDSVAGTEVDVGLAGALAADAWEVELTGLTPDAQWMPAYELRLDAAPASRATLTAVALVRQSTGEDWNDIELVATTARPPLAEPPPALRRLEVVGVPSDEDRTVISSHEELARLTGMGTVPPTQATVEYSATASVPAHGRAVRVELFTVELPVTSQLEVAPSDHTTPVQAAIVDNVGGMVLLPGNVSVFRDAHYAGQSQIGFVAAGERFVVPVGTDGRVRVERLVHRSPPRRSSLTGTTAYDFTHVTTVENLSSDELEIVVRDRTPISKSDGASVKLMERPADLVVDPSDGRTHIRLRLPGHAARQLELAYRITAGRGVSIDPPRDL